MVDDKIDSRAVNEPCLTVANALSRGQNNLDLIRIIAALMVIFGHSFALTLNPNAQEPFSYFFNFTYSGSIAVKIFFFISGLLVTNSMMRSNDILTFVSARFFRIYPAFAATIIITGLVIGPVVYSGTLEQYYDSGSYVNYIVNSLHFNTQYFIDGVFTGNKDGGSINGSLWTIAIEVSAYLLVLSAYIFTGFKNKIILNTLCILTIVIPLTSIDGLNFIAERTSEAFLLPSCFALGSLYAINKNNIHADLKIPIAFFIIYKVSYSPLMSYFAFYAGVCTLALWLSTTRIAKMITIRKDISYGIYLWGFPIQQSLSYFYGLSTIQLIIFSSILSIIAGYVSFVFIESPAIALSKKIISRQNEGKAHP
ncbi:acyltransferase [Kluyvera intermedia]|uniref:acyltransferase family protein n=1 Tax=Kluyvera intermedia TaxID=61648 RepID=UPI0009EF3AB0|nr:acyltransferase [Kluyvera intermedia]WQD28628.1 acyltransferase [Kluyvera intermedia]VDZ84305.1 Uncharacterized protein conserved in bacteria [Kluyvera intermedia]